MAISQTAMGQSVFSPDFDSTEESRPAPRSSAGLPPFQSDAERFLDDGRSRQIVPPVGNQLQPRNLLQWGPIVVHPRINYRFLHATDVAQRETDIHQITPGFSALLGDFWALNYAAGLRFYFDPAQQDTVVHNASLHGNVPVREWNLGLAQQFSIKSEPLVETGAETSQKTFGTSLTAERVYDRVGLDFMVNQRIQDASGFSGSKTWQTAGWLNYQLSQPLSAGVGLTVGYADVEIGKDMVYEQLNGRIRWTPGNRKFSAQFNFGGEIRQFLDSNLPSRINPIFGITLNYQPWEPTYLALRADRAVRASLLANTISEYSQVSFTIQQRFLGKLFLNVSPGYRVSEFVQTFARGDIIIFNNGFIIVPTDFATARRDESFFVSTRLSMQFLKKGRVSVFHYYNNNKSSATALEFQSTQVGFDIGYTF